METEQKAQVLPSSGPIRKALQEKGQFWTPAWVAEAMVAYVLAQGASRIFDPSVRGPSSKPQKPGRGRMRARSVSAAWRLTSLH